MRYFLILVGAAVVAYLLSRGHRRGPFRPQTFQERGIEMKPADLQIVKAAKPRSLAVAIGTGLLFVLILFLAFGSWFQVDQGERGVVLRNGKLVRVAEPGLDFKTLSSTTCRWCRCATTFVFENLEAYSYDQQPATLRVSVTYRVPAERVAELCPSTAPSTICRDACWSARRPTPSRACSAASPPCAIQERQKLGLDVNTAVVEAMDGAPVQVVGVQIEEVGFSKAYEHSIEQRMLAQVQIETTRQQKETAVINAEIQVVKAKAESRCAAPAVHRRGRRHPFARRGRGGGDPRQGRGPGRQHQSGRPERRREMGWRVAHHAGAGRGAALHRHQVIALSAASRRRA